jgi:hypothetical protein
MVINFQVPQNVQNLLSRLMAELLAAFQEGLGSMELVN